MGCAGMTPPRPSIYKETARPRHGIPAYAGMTGWRRTGVMRYGNDVGCARMPSGAEIPQSQIANLRSPISDGVPLYK